jgi:hypothetical protein
VSVCVLMPKPAMPSGRTRRSHALAAWRISRNECSSSDTSRSTTGAARSRTCGRSSPPSGGRDARSPYMSTTGALLGRVLAEHALVPALRAVGVFAVRRVPRAPQVLKARRIVGELAHELHERERRFRARGADRVVTVDRRHTVKLLDKRVFVK